MPDTLHKGGRQKSTTEPWSQPSLERIFSSCTAGSHGVALWVLAGCITFSFALTLAWLFLQPPEPQRFSARWVTQLCSRGQH